MQKIWNCWKLSTKLTLAFTLLIIMVSATMTVVVYFQLVHTQRQALKERLVDILNFGTPQVDGSYHSLIQKPGEENTPFYYVVKTKLQSIQNSSNIVDHIFTIRQSGEKDFQYVVDASKQNLHQIGDPFNEPAAIKKYNLLTISKPLIEEAFIMDSEGAYWRGYAPIYDQFNDLDGILVIDVQATTVIQNEIKAVNNALFAFLITVPLALFFGYRLARFLTSPVNELVKGAERVSQGDLTKPVPVISQDELGILSTAFNHMITRLQQTLTGLEMEIAKHQWAEKVQNAIFRISQTVVSTDSMQEMFRSIHTILGELIPVDNFFIALFDEKSNSFTFPYYIDQYDPPPKSLSFRNGLTEYVIRTQRSLLINRAGFDELFNSGAIKIVGTPPMQWLGVPLMVENRILGVVAVQSYDNEEQFDLENLNLIEFISTQVALAIEHKSAAELIQQSNQRYRVLFEDSPISLWEEDFSKVKEIIDQIKDQGITDFRTYLNAHPDILTECAEKIRVLDVNKATVELFGAKSKEEILINLSSVFYDSSYAPFREEIVNIAEGQMEFSWDGTNRTLDGRQIDVSLNWSVVPGHENDLSRVIVSMQDITERRTTEKKLLYISSHDALTGLYNRAYFDEELSRLERGRHFPVSVIMVDVDKLKIINDQHGHAAGDAVLQQVAQVLNMVFRAEDVIARIGGDEFAVLLPGINPAGAAKAIQRIQSKLLKQNSTPQKNPLSLSCGCSTAEKPGTLSSALIQADTNMYLEKYSKQETTIHKLEADAKP